MNALENTCGVLAASRATTSNAHRVVDAMDAHRSFNGVNGVKVEKPLHRYAWVGPAMPSDSASSRQLHAGNQTDHRPPMLLTEDNTGNGCSSASYEASSLVATEGHPLPMISSSFWTPSAGSCFRPPAPRQAVFVDNQDETTADVTGLQVVNHRQQIPVDNDTMSVESGFCIYTNGPSMPWKEYREKPMMFTEEELLPILIQNQPPVEAGSSSSNANLKPARRANTDVRGAAADVISTPQPTFVTSAIPRATPTSVRPELFHAVIRMIALVEGGGLVDRNGTEFGIAVADANYGMQINGSHRLVYTRQFGLQLIDFVE